MASCSVRDCILENLAPGQHIRYAPHPTPPSSWLTIFPPTTSLAYRRSQSPLSYIHVSQLASEAFANEAKTMRWTELEVDTLVDYLQQHHAEQGGGGFKDTTEQGINFYFSPAGGAYCLHIQVIQSALWSEFSESQLGWCLIWMFSILVACCFSIHVVATMFFIWTNQTMSHFYRNHYMYMSKRSSSSNPTTDSIAWLIKMFW